ncbi:MAG: ATP cone domain-containing protein [Candidatus Heimdallarchaeota archaeon]
MPRNSPKKIVKMDGSSQTFEKQKIVNSLLNVGVPEDMAFEIAEKISAQIEERTTTREIRAFLLEELRKRNEEWYDNYIYFDRIVKKRVTYEKGKFVEIKKGNLYLGREVQDIGQKGLSDLNEIQAILNELEEDLVQGMPERKINSRTWILYMAILKSKKMKNEDIEKAIKLLNEFRKKRGWKPYKPKKPV